MTTVILNYECFYGRGCSRYHDALYAHLPKSCLAFYPISCIPVGNIGDLGDPNLFPPTVLGSKKRYRNPNATLVNFKAFACLLISTQK